MRLETKEIIKRARAKILELTDEVITAESVLQYANLSYDEIQIRVRSNSMLTSVLIPISGSVGTLPDLFGTFYGSPKDNNGNIIRVVPLQNVIRAASSERVCSRMGQEVKLPTDSQISSLEVVYYAKYDALTVANSPETDETFDEPMIYGIVYRALEDLQDPELSTYYKGLYDNMILDRASFLSSYEENATEGEIFTPVRFI